MKKSVLETKKMSWKKFGQRMEADSKGNQKLFYNVLKSFRSQKKYSLNHIKNNEGNILTASVKQMEKISSRAVNCRKL